MEPSTHEASQAANPEKAVFLNVPYDREFAPLFLAYICGISAFGMLPRATLELQGGTRRLDRIISLIESCEYSIHDLSWVDLDPMPPKTPRFNMPFELGLSVLHTSRNPKRHTWFLFESTSWRIQKSLSDLNGTDPYIHDGTVEGIFREMARAFTRARRQPSAQQMMYIYQKLGDNFPRILSEAATKDPFHSRAFRDIVIYTSAVAKSLF